MIYTCTLNPAIDLFIEADDLLPNKVNRTKSEDYQANGKGVNVSIILKKLGMGSTALGFKAGFTGAYIQDELHAMGIDTDFVEIDGITRVNIFVHTGDQEYKIVNRGPNVDTNAYNKMIEKIKSLPDQSTLFVSGSAPRGVDESIYKEIAKIAFDKQIDLILDISSEVLMDCLQYNPFLIKPNKEELAHFYGKEDLTEDDIIYYGRDLLDKGAKHVLISLGEDGAIYIDKDHLLKVSSPKGKVVNTACAGDTMLAMFYQKMQAGFSIEDTMVYASAAGSSTAFSEGLSDLQDVSELMKQINTINLRGGKKNG
ncbi:1-phosphofructokinase [Ornithinibacillus gellani]|uniref:1-phosphofructokinase n=1 Tax=Ornithinibacillus gellani TaxID=2293253 RepID=UPI000F4A11E0|nr:1-phosphofructokinase [Ornithinibacillus gellani]TQS71154.1 1-phosphofructokinase [Ornithinibacillus gellani]